MAKVSSAAQLWAILVDKASESGRLTFITEVVTKLAAGIAESGKLAEHLVIGMRREGGQIELNIFPAGNIAEQVKRLSAVLNDPRDGDAVAVRSLNFVDTETGVSGAGLGLFMDGRQALAIGGAADHLVLRADGFERSIVGMVDKDDVPTLWDRVRRIAGELVSKTVPAAQAGKQKTKVAIKRSAGRWRRAALLDRKESKSAAHELGLALPAMTVRTFDLGHLDGAGTESSDTHSVAVLVPIRGLKDSAGGYPSRALVGRLRAALGVHIVLTEHGLGELLGDRAAALEEIERVTPMSMTHMRDIGLQHLSAKTACENETEVARWAKSKYRNHVRPRRRQGMAELVQQELASVRLLSVALQHAQRLVAAYNDAESKPKAKGEVIIREAWRRAPAMSAGALFQIAAFGDINPAPLWPFETDGLGDALEAGRVAGRAQVGVETVLNRNVQHLLRQGLEALAANFPPDGLNGREFLLRLAADRLANIVGRDQLAVGIEQAMAVDGDIHVARSTRKMTIVGAPAGGHGVEAKWECRLDQEDAELLVAMEVFGANRS